MGGSAAADDVVQDEEHLVGGLEDLVARRERVVGCGLPRELGQEGDHCFVGPVLAFQGVGGLMGGDGGWLASLDVVFISRFRKSWEEVEDEELTRWGCSACLTMTCNSSAEMKVLKPVLYGSLDCSKVGCPSFQATFLARGKSWLRSSSWLLRDTSSTRSPMRLPTLPRLLMTLTQAWASWTEKNST